MGWPISGLPGLAHPSSSLSRTSVELTEYHDTDYPVFFIIRLANGVKYKSELKVSNLK
jgi:hypothetical protein